MISPILKHGGAGTLFLLLFLTGCSQKPDKVFYLNSYHRGFHSSDQILAGIEDTFRGQEVELRTHFMDTKRNPEPESIEAAARVALEEIQAFGPDLIIASDDNAVKHVISPHFRGGPTPVLFCGVNWNCDAYGLPTAYATGMLEVLPVKEILEELKTHYPRAKTLTVLSELSVTERKNKEILDPLYRELGLEPVYALVSNFADWKEAFIRANDDSDLVFVFTNGAIQGWDDEEAAAFVETHIKKPVFTVEEHMMPFAVIGFSKVAREQGEWVARTALEVLAGRSMESVDLTRNQQTQNFLNPSLAERIQFAPKEDLSFKVLP